MECFVVQCADELVHYLPSSPTFSYVLWSLEFPTRFARLLKLLIDYVNEEDVIDIAEKENRRTEENLVESVAQSLSLFGFKAYS